LDISIGIFKDIIWRMRCFLFLSSKDLRIVYASPYTRALFGSRSGHIIGEPLTNFLHPDV